MRRLNSQRGLTLVELIVVVAIVGILAVMGLPAYSGFVANAKVSNAADTLNAELLWARSEAVKRNTPLQVSVSSTSVATSDMTDAERPLQIRSTALTQAEVTPFQVTFSTRGWPTPFGSVTAATVKPLTAPCGAEIRCARITVEAGGGVKLCRGSECN